MSPKFGTSGLRGLVTDLTPELVTTYVHAFLSSGATGSGLFVGHDLRASSPDIAETVSQAAQGFGISVSLCGPVPTPALACVAMANDASAIMVTGSHIPADRNGLKFYTPKGEITKTDETRIQRAIGGCVQPQPRQGIEIDSTINAQWADRYLSAFAGSLSGLCVGVYQHSAVGRDSLVALLTALGAKVTPLGRSDVFVPVDTEALPIALRLQLRDWAAVHRLDAIISTDADGDRPLVTDQFGEVVPGDVLGQIVAEALGADTIVTPISSNSGVACPGRFKHVSFTRIGSPYVIAEMERRGGRAIGYEANGGLLLGFEAQGPTGVLPPLMTRDAVLPIVTVLAQSNRRGVAALRQQQPARFTATDRLQDIDLAKVRRLIGRLQQDERERADFLLPLGSECGAIDTTDGLRMTLKDGRIVHLRPSGNAPEMRVYVEAAAEGIAQDTCAAALSILAGDLTENQRN